MHLTEDDVELFRRFSGDANPMHVSETFARRTPFGEPIAHGMLGCLAALNESGQSFAGVRELEAQFRRPILLGTQYDVKDMSSSSTSENASREEKHRIGVFDGGRLCLDLCARTGRQEADSPGLIASTPEFPAVMVTEPVHRSLAELSLDTEVVGGYRPREELMSELAQRWPHAVANLGVRWITAMAWSSFLAGMELPGQYGLLCRVRLSVDPSASHAPVRYTAHAVDIDHSFGVVTVAGELRTASATMATVELDAMVPSPVPAPLLRSIDRVLAPSKRLVGRTAAVVGGSRGLGAGLALALAGQGCRVLVGHREAGALAPLREQSAGRGGELVSVPGDASAASWTTDVSRHLAEAGDRLDYLVLSAAPSIGVATFTPEGAVRVGDYTARTLDLVSVPLSGLADVLERSAGRCLAISSAALDSLPPEWPHYVAAKSAVEGLLRWTAATHPGAGWFAVRPGMVLTDQVNTPAGREEASPVEEIAGRICARFLEADAEPGRVRYLTGET